MKEVFKVFLVYASQTQTMYIKAGSLGDIIRAFPDAKVVCREMLGMTTREFDIEL